MKQGHEVCIIGNQYVSSSILTNIHITNVCFEETVMSVLLPAFHFEKTDDVVDWRLGITLSPYVRGKEAEGPQVPMKISKL